MKALVADRSATTRRIVIRALRAVGVFEVLEAADAGAAVTMLDAEPAILVIEWPFGDEATIDLITCIRAREGAPQPRILILSERDRRPDVERAAGLGINGYVLKPFETRTLVEQLAAALREIEPGQEAA